LPTEVLNDVDLDSFRIQKTFEDRIELDREDGEVAGIGTTTGGIQESEQDMLSAIIEQLNETHHSNFTEEDKVDVMGMEKNLYQNEDLRVMMTADNTPANKKKKFDEILDSMFLDFVHTKLDLYQKLTQPDTNSMLKQVWFDKFQQEINQQQL